MHICPSDVLTICMLLEQVDELLKCGICKFCAARSLSKQVTSHLLPVAQRLLHFSRRHITPSASLRDAAACAMLAIELVAEVSPNETVVDDLCIGANLQSLMYSYYQPLYQAVYHKAVQHGMVVASTRASLSSMFHSQPLQRSSS